MKKILSVLALTTAVAVITSSVAPAHAGFNWNDVWGAIKKGGVQQPTPEASTPSISNGGDTNGVQPSTGQDDIPSPETSNIPGVGGVDNDSTDSISIE